MEHENRSRRDVLKLGVGGASFLATSSYPALSKGGCDGFIDCAWEIGSTFVKSLSVIGRVVDGWSAVKAIGSYFLQQDTPEPRTYQNQGHVQLNNNHLAEINIKVSRIMHELEEQKESSQRSAREREILRSTLINQKTVNNQLIHLMRRMYLFQYYQMRQLWLANQFPLLVGGISGDNNLNYLGCMNRRDSTMLEAGPLIALNYMQQDILGQDISQNRPAIPLNQDDRILLEEITRPKRTLRAPFRGRNQYADTSSVAYKTNGGGVGLQWEALEERNGNIFGAGEYTFKANGKIYKGITPRMKLIRT